MVVRSSGRFDVGSARIRICPKVSTRGRSVFTWVYAASLFIPLGSSLKLLWEWLPVVASVACLVVAASLFVLLDRWDCQSAKMPETNAIARATKRGLRCDCQKEA